jgi:hypothetical protein
LALEHGWEFHPFEVHCEEYESRHVELSKDVGRSAARRCAQNFDLDRLERDLEHANVSTVGLPWIIGNDTAAGGFGIWLYDGQTGGTNVTAKDVWLRITNGATAISVGPNGRPWVAASDGTIWHLSQ